MLSKELKDLVMEFGPYYFVKDLPLYELITHEFINTFVKKGKKNHVVSVNVVGCGRSGRSHRNSRAPALFESDRWSSSVRSGVCSPPSAPQQLSLLRAPSGWVSDSTGPHASLGGVVTHGLWRGEALRHCVQMQCMAARSTVLHAAPTTAVSARGLLMRPRCLLQGQVLTGAPRLLLGPCGPQSTCVCWVDWLVPVTSWEPLV